MAIPTPVLIRRLLRLAVALLIIGVIAADAAQVLPAQKTAADAVSGAMSAAVVAASAAPAVQDSGYQAAAAAAASLGGTVESYSQRFGEVRGGQAVMLTVEVSAPVGRTLVAAAVLGVINGTPMQEWYSPGSSRVILTETKRVDVY